MADTPPVTEFDTFLADECLAAKPLTMPEANSVFTYFKNSPLFRWQDANNDCEDRANAACLLLDNWGISNCKAWVFSGDFRKAEPGTLTNIWNYHVAAALPVQTENGVLHFVLDPATASELVSIEDWAKQITASGKSYHFVKEGDYYIFPSGLITKENWYRRNRRNYNWTMQGLSGINGVSVKGKAQLALCAYRVERTAEAFRKLRLNKPAFESQ